MRLPTVRACLAILLLGGVAAAGRAAVHSDAPYDDTPGAAPARTLDLHVPDEATAGAGDSTELLNRRFAAGLEAAWVDVTLEVFAEESHGSINSRLGTPGHAPTTALTAFLDRLLEP